MKYIYNLHPTYNKIFSAIGNHIGEDICWKITQLYQSELEKTVAVGIEDDPVIAQSRHKSGDIAMQLIGLLEDKYVKK